MAQDAADAAAAQNDNPELGAIVTEAQERFKEVQTWESTASQRWQDDYRFANADPENGYQWPNEIQKNRDVEDRPCLTVNITQQFNLQIINQQKKNKPRIKIRPTGGQATFEAAQVWEGLCRFIEYDSNAQIAYDLASEFQVQCGLGWWRVNTKFVDDRSFDQKIVIEPITDPLTVFLDPFIKMRDGSDAKWGFVFSDLPRKEAEKRWPDLKDKLPLTSLGASEGWITKDTVRVAEYFRKVEFDDELLDFTVKPDDPASERKTVLKSSLPENVYTTIAADPATRKRPSKNSKIEWFLIVGSEVVDETVWPGKYIPLVRVVGIETVIDGILDRKGNTRAMKDSQRIYNYWSSSAVENVALQGKTPWVAPAKAIEGYEVYYEQANRVNHAVLPYNDWDDDGQRQIAPPQRAQPPVMAAAYVQGMRISIEELHRVTGQHSPNMDGQVIERTGAALNASDERGETAWFHFVDNFALAIAYTGRIILDLAPHIYDTKRVMQILNEDGTDAMIELDPEIKQSLVREMNQAGEITKLVLNPKVNQYNVQADSGPGYKTKRREAFQALTLMLTQSKELTPIIGDLMLKAGDFPLADEAAMRLRRMVPRQALGLGPTQNEQALTEQLQNLQALYAETLEQLGRERNASKSKDQLRQIDAYKAETDRMKALIEGLDRNQTQMMGLVQQLVEQAQRTSLDPVIEASTQGLRDDVAGPTPVGGNALMGTLGG
jgi:hypothetical protein